MSASELPCLVAQSDSQDTLELFAHVLHFLTRTPDVLVSRCCDIEDGAPACALPPLVPLAPCAAARLAYFSPPWPGGRGAFRQPAAVAGKGTSLPHWKARASWSNQRMHCRCGPMHVAAKTHRLTRFVVSIMLFSVTQK